MKKTNQPKETMTKLIWKKTSKKFNGCYASWYAISPLNNFVFIAKDQGGQWSNHIIYKKHLHLINDIDWLNVDDLSHNLIDCACHTLKGSKAEFQKFVNNFNKNNEYTFNFYILKDYIQSTKGNNEKI